MDCLFCKIIAGEIPSENIVYEDEFSIAFLDLYPNTEGHTLVVPKKHFTMITDMTEEETGKLFRSVNAVSRKVVEGLGLEGFNITVNNGKVANQEIPHVHVHIIPRYVTEGRSELKLVGVDKARNDNLKKIADRIRGK